MPEGDSRLASLALESYRGCRAVLIACSGGPDSVALLYASVQARAMGGPDIYACHVEHGIRGEASLRDAGLTADICSRLSVPLKTVHVDAPGFARANGLSLETAARELRHGALRDAALGFGADGIAFAHHSGDQAETVLMHILRGSGAAGATGIKARYIDKSGLVFLRPLLAVPKQELIALCDSAALPYATDETNTDTAYARNLIRKAIKDISAAYPGAEKALGRFAEIVSWDEEYFAPIISTAAGKIRRSEGESFIPDEISALPKSILYRLLLAELQLYGDMGLVHTETAAGLLLGPIGGGADLISATARRVHGGLLLRKKGYSPEIRETPFTGCGEYIFPTGSLTISLARALTFGCLPSPPRGVYYLDAASCAGGVFRGRRKGDTIRPYGLGGRKTVKDYMYDRKIPAHMRDVLPLLDVQGEILWVAGCDISAGAAITPSTRVAYVFTWLAH